MAGNPLQNIIQMVMQQAQQNPQMLQQIMQMASGPAGQGIIQMLMEPQAPRYPGSQEPSDVPLPSGLGGGKPYPTYNFEQDDKAYVRELRQDNLVPPQYPPTPGLHPQLMPLLEQQRSREPVDDYLQPGEPEPIAQLQPGLLSRLANDEGEY